MKVYIHYEEPGAPEKTSKLSIPKSWVSNKLVSDVIELFVDAYNKANPDHALVKNEVYLQTSEAMKIYSDVKIEGNLEDLFDYFIKKGVHLRTRVADTSASAAANDGKLRCKNYGCNQFYTEECNSNSSVCCHHTGPPVFHDLVKYWSCCPEKKAYDWDEFQLITGCATGVHSTVDPKVAIGRGIWQHGHTEGTEGNAGEPASSSAATVAAPATVLKSISDYNTANPDAASATTTATKVATAERASTRKDDGTARCRNKGCNKTFNYAEDVEGGNTPTSCNYHAGQPVFHDAIKYWACCADKKCYDFESFMEVPGCMQGYHDDGVISEGKLAAAAATVQK